MTKISKRLGQLTRVGRLRQVHVLFWTRIRFLPWIYRGQNSNRTKKSHRMQKLWVMQSYWCAKICETKGTRLKAVLKWTPQGLIRQRRIGWRPQLELGQNGLSILIDLTGSGKYRVYKNVSQIWGTLLMSNFPKTWKLKALTDIKVKSCKGMRGHLVLSRAKKPLEARLFSNLSRVIRSSMKMRPMRIASTDWWALIYPHSRDTPTEITENQRLLGTQW